MQKEITRILVVRGDKIGDVVLVTPAIAALRKKYKSARIAALIKKNVYDILAGNPHLDRVISQDPELHSGIAGFFRLFKEIRQERFELLVFFQGTFKLAFLCWLARISIRIGPLSKWWSWIFFNRGMRQNRSAVEMHEADYNLQLLGPLGIAVNEAREKTLLVVQKEDQESAKKFFADKGILKKFKTVAIHPGMAGSALNWPEDHYIRLGKSLLRRYNLVITGGPGEEDLVNRVSQEIASEQTFDIERPVLCKFLGEKDQLSALIGILDYCDSIVVPSTGPMHLASALGKKVVTVFSPIKVQSAVRWGPYGISKGSNLGVAPNDGASVLVPDVNCAENFKCALSACIYYPCMPRISVEDVETQLSVLMEGGEVSMYKSPLFLGENTLEEDI